MAKHTATTVTPTETPVAHEEANSWMNDPVVWIGLSVAIFAALFVRYVWPILAKGLDDRSAQIRDQLEQASRLRAEAEALLNSYKAEQEEAAREAEHIIEAAKADAQALRDRAAQELHAALDRRSQQAMEKIKRAEQEATAQIRLQMVEAATKQAAEIVRNTLEAAPEEDPGIARAIAAISQQLH